MKKGLFKFLYTEEEVSSNLLEEITDTEPEERDYHPIRFQRNGSLGILKGLMLATFIICLSAVLAIVCWLSASDILALGKDEQTAVITLSNAYFKDMEVEIKDEDGNVTGTKTVKAADMNMVAGLLKDNGIIEYKRLFKLFSKFAKAELKIDPGTYTLSTSLDYRAIIKNMQVGTAAMSVITITFPEGYTVDQIFTKLEENEVCSKESLYKAVTDFNFNYKFLDDAPEGEENRLEGFIFPNTYDFYQGEQAASVINKFLEALHYNITADMWRQADNLGITFREAIIIASLIEREAANDEERYLISSVIHNRLRGKIELGIDSSILYVYPLTEGADINAIMSMDSPYNTRLYKGLPPTPICNPGLESIKAALNPTNTSYYYYALDMETKTHKFFYNKDSFDAFTATQNYDELYN